MRREENRGGRNKKGADRPIPKSGTKSAANKGARKSTPAGAKTKGAPARTATARTKTGLAFSYQSADDRNMLDIIEVIRAGVSYKDFSKIVDETPFTLSEWAAYLQLSERTIQRNQKEQKPFQPIQSERIVELNMLYRYGVEVFGDKDNFNSWLTTRSMALGGRSPRELLDTKFGISMVKDELGRIEHGVLA